VAEDGGERVERAIMARSASAVPPDGEWPCQMTPRGDLPVRLVAFMYRLLRDGASGPGDVEGHLLQAGLHDEDPRYTNCHLEMLARAHVTWLLGGPRSEPRDQLPTRILLAIGLSPQGETTPPEILDKMRDADYVIAAKAQDIGLVKNGDGGGVLEVVRV
jgi:hypothetical protein